MTEIRGELTPWTGQWGVVVSEAQTAEQYTLANDTPAGTFQRAMRPDQCEQPYGKAARLAGAFATRVNQVQPPALRDKVYLIRPDDRTVVKVD